MPDAAPPRRRVAYVDFAAQFAEERVDILACVEQVFAAGVFVGGAAVADLEAKIAGYLGSGHVVAVNSGTDALILAMRALGIGAGDEVVTPPNSFVASTGAIVAVGARPVFADVRADQNLDPAAVEKAITAKTRAIMPVHLTGRVADMDPIMEIALRRGLPVVEDAAQAFGSRYRGRPAGTIGDVGCFSAHPLKNLNAAGDAGFIATKDAALAERLRRVRNHGLADRDAAVEWGIVSRLDTLQAAILKIRLGRVDSVIERRRHNAEHYRERLADTPAFVPPCRAHEFNTFHTFVVQADQRDELKAFLAARGIETAVHYPLPIHLQPAARALGHKPGDFPVAEAQARRILSLPIHQFLTDDDIDFVAETISEFYR